MNVNKGTRTIVLSFVGALVLGIFGDFLVYEVDEETGEAIGSSIGFEEGSTGAEIVNIAPALLVVFGLYLGYQHMTPEDED